jgi:hypothetical protein
MIKIPVRSIVGAIDAAAARWRDASYEPRVRARDAAGARTGYSLPTIEYAFDRLFETLRRDAIEAVIADELGCLDALERFVERSGRPHARALALGRVCIVSSRTTIGVAIVPAIFALCAKCDVLVKDREDHLVAAFFETLFDELPEMRHRAVARTWQGDDEVADLNGFAVVVAFASDATVAKIAETLPFSTRLIVYGSKASAGYVSREALESEAAALAIAEGAARDVVLYESQGCLSLHTLFVERGGAVAPRRFTEILSGAMHNVATDFSPAPAIPATAARLALARDLAKFRAADRTHSDPHAGYLAVADPPLDAPPLFLPRAIFVHSIDRPSQAAEYLERHGISLEALAVTRRRRSDLLELAIRTNAARVARFGSLQAPPLGGFHGGRPRIAEFVRWIVDET